MEAEGWYRDPYGAHTDRWFSDGAATDLVRDDGVESRDAPPDEPVEGPLAEVSAQPPADGADLLRADAASAEPSYDPVDAAVVAAEAVTTYFPPG